MLLYYRYIYGFITLSDKQSISMLESESVAAVAMLNIHRLAEIIPQVTSVAFGFRQCRRSLTGDTRQPILINFNRSSDRFDEPAIDSENLA